MDETVANNPQLRFTLETARAWGVSPSRFLGREQVRTVQHEYDLMGNLVRSVETMEPEWTDEDRTMAMELQDYEAGLCPGCRYPMAETTAPENEFAYQAELPLRCHRCTASERAMKAHEGKEAPSALYMQIALRGANNDNHVHTG